MPKRTCWIFRLCPHLSVHGITKERGRNSAGESDPKPQKLKESKMSRCSRGEWWQAMGDCLREKAQGFSKGEWYGGS